MTDSNAANTTIPAPFSLKVSEKEKYEKDCSWFKNYMKYIIPATNTTIEDYANMKLSYDIANNNLEGFKEKLSQFCSPLGQDIGEIEEEVVPYPELHNKINVLKGEIISRNDTHRIMLLTPQAIQEKTDRLTEEIRGSIDEKVAIALEKQKAQLQGMKEDEIKQYTDSLRKHLEPEDLLQKEYLTEEEIFYTKSLQYCYYTQDIKMKKMDSFEDTIIADRMFIYVGWKHGKPNISLRNPLFCGFHKSPDERFVHKSDWLWYKKAITPSEVMSNYDLTDEQLDQLGLRNYNVSALDKRHDITLPDSKPVYSHIDQELMMESDNPSKTYTKDIGLNMSNSSVINKRRHLVWETHFEFKAYKELIFLSYIDDYNFEIVKPVSIDFEIPKDAKKETFINRYGSETSRWVWLIPIDI